MKSLPDSKSHVEVKVDAILVEEAEKMGIDIQKTTGDFLRTLKAKLSLPPRYANEQPH